MAFLQIDALLGIAPGWPGCVTVGSPRVLILWLDPTDPISPVSGASSAFLIARRAHRCAGIDQITWLPLGSLWTVAGLATIRRSGSGEAVMHGLHQARVGTMLALIVAGARHFHFTFAGGATLSAPAATALLLGIWGTAQDVLRRTPFLVRALPRSIRIRLQPPATSVRGVRAAIQVSVVSAGRPAKASSPAKAPPNRAGKLAIVHHIGSLGAGGAERQLTYLASQSNSRGHQVTIATSESLGADNGHFRSDFESSGVTVKWVSEVWSSNRLVAWLDGEGAGPSRELRDVVAHHPGWRALVPLIVALRDDPPDVLHCWLDDPNSQGGLADLLTGIPKIVLSTRNVNPDHFPRLPRTWHRPGYRLLLRSGRVPAIASSLAGAFDYASWSNVEASRFEIIHNGIPLSTLVPARDAERVARRAEVGFGVDAFVVAGVFRMAVEKRPFDFVRAIDLLRKQVPNVRAFLIGTGPEEQRTRELAELLGLESVISFLGRSEHPNQLLAMADACLLPSEYEGCPNVPLKAQALEVPAIVTRGGRRTRGDPRGGDRVRHECRRRRRDGGCPHATGAGSRARTSHGSPRSTVGRGAIFDGALCGPDSCGLRCGRPMRRIMNEPPEHPAARYRQAKSGRAGRHATQQPHPMDGSHLVRVQGRICLHVRARMPGSTSLDDLAGFVSTPWVLRGGGVYPRPEGRPLWGDRCGRPYDISRQILRRRLDGISLRMDLTRSTDPK